MEDKFENKSINWDTPERIERTQRFVKEIIFNHKFKFNDKLIEFGCGTGLVGLQFIEKVSKIFMLDTSLAMLKNLEIKIKKNNYKNIIPIFGELTSYKNDLVDAIIGFMVLHHIDDVEVLLKESYDNLNKNGVLIIGDLLEEDGSFHGYDFVFHNGFNIENLKKMFTNQGFIDIYVNIYGSVPKNGRDYPLFIMIGKK